MTAEAWCPDCRRLVAVDWIDGERVPPRHVPMDPKARVGVWHVTADATGRAMRHEFDVSQPEAADLIGRALGRR